MITHADTQAAALDVQSSAHRVVNDPVGVCMLLMLGGMPHLAASFASDCLRANGAYVPEPKQAAGVRSHLYAIKGGKRS